jgi:hypothetical protein
MLYNIVEPQKRKEMKKLRVDQVLNITLVLMVLSILILGLFRTELINIELPNIQFSEIISDFFTKLLDENTSKF